MTTFKDRDLQRLYKACRRFGSDKSSTFYLSNGLPHRGASHRCAYWDGRGGRKSPYPRGTLGYAAWAAGRDDRKQFGSVAGWDYLHRDMARDDGSVSLAKRTSDQARLTKEPVL